jgi:hypothetical protein
VIGSKKNNAFKRNNALNKLSRSGKIVIERSVLGLIDKCDLNDRSASSSLVRRAIPHTPHPILSSLLVPLLPPNSRSIGMQLTRVLRQRTAALQIECNGIISKRPWMKSTRYLR